MRECGLLYIVARKHPVALFDTKLVKNLLKSHTEAILFVCLFVRQYSWRKFFKTILRIAYRSCKTRGMLSQDCGTIING